MVALIFCDVTVDLIALATAIATGIAVSWTFVGSAVSFIGDILFVVGGAATLVGSVAPAIPAALLFLSAFGLTLPVVLK
ncbi:MAG TPA: hypothetical protein VEG44_02860 [Candidatus Acidoferrales bacterium]|nr:hypothetical protein [Candidatus Acidoferrales bacterium]HYA61119.1 hypothetical protein [Candidatus Acidoferrum sp.]